MAATAYDTTYDIVTIGGGLAASALAKAMAEKGARVLVLERETRFRDRVRGEAIMSWGASEVRELGLYEAIVAAGGHQLPFWDGYQDSSRSGHRDLERTTPCKEPVLACFHPSMQEALLQAAADSGAQVRRGARVTGLRTDGTPVVTAEVDGRSQEISARLVVGADGRASRVRRWGGFGVHQDPDGNMVAGILLDGVTAPDDATLASLNSEYGLFVLLFPQGQGRARAYVCYRAEAGYRLSGHKDLPRFLENTIKGGAPPEFYAEAQPAGPLVTFSGAASWVDRPYRNGIALIGDAASTADPTWGQGMSMAFRDARMLRDQLLRFDDWQEAGEAYAESWQKYYGTVHTAETWQTRLLMETGPEADARRQRAFPLWREDRTRNPDVFLSGPIRELDETARRRFFGEE